MKSKPKPNPAILLKAIKLFYNNPRIKYTCIVILIAADDIGSFPSDKYDTKEWYEDLFEINSKYYTFRDRFACNNDELEEMRLLSLCLAYEIATCIKQKKSHR